MPTLARASRSLILTAALLVGFTLGFAYALSTIPSDHYPTYPVPDGNRAWH